MTTIATALEAHLTNMETCGNSNRKYLKHWNNDSPAAWLSKESRDALDGKVSKVSVNFIRLAVRSLVERLTVRGFIKPGQNQIDQDLLALTQRVNFNTATEIIHTDRALYGTAYCTVWNTRDGSRPVLITDTAATVSTETDPATGEVLSGMRVWRDGDTAQCVYFTPETIRRYQTDLVAGASIVPSLNWQHISTNDNPLEVVPIVEFRRQHSSRDYRGVSAVADILELNDALAKVLGDAMVTSEYFAKPRRWATGLEIREDDDGNPIDPFGKSRLLQSEDPDTKFGQLNASTPGGQTELIATITQQIGALTGLPAHYLGLHGDQPASAEGVRAAETQLVMAARGEQRQLDSNWSQVASLLAALDAEGHPADHPYITQWDNPEIKTPAQAADAAGKLRDIGVPLATLLSDPLGYDPEEIPDIVEAATQEQLIAGVNLGGGNIGA